MMEPKLARTSPLVREKVQGHHVALGTGPPQWQFSISMGFPCCAIREDHRSRLYSRPQPSSCAEVSGRCLGWVLVAAQRGGVVGAVRAEAHLDGVKAKGHQRIHVARVARLVRAVVAADAVVAI